MVEGYVRLLRDVFERACKDLKDNGKKYEFFDYSISPYAKRSSKRVLVTVWKTFEQKHGSDADAAKVQGRIPIMIRKRRKVDEADDREEECKSLLSYFISSFFLFDRIPSCFVES